VTDLSSELTLYDYEEKSNNIKIQPCSGSRTVGKPRGREKARQQFINSN